MVVWGDAEASSLGNGGTSKASTLRTQRLVGGFLDAKSLRKRARETVSSVCWGNVDMIGKANRRTLEDLL